MVDTQVRAMQVSVGQDGKTVQQIELRTVPSLTQGKILVRVQYAALNYKDGLAMTGNPGVARALPLVPGIDAVGEVVESQSSIFEVGENVIVQHPDFGTSQDGGYQQYVCVPESWAIKRPDNLSNLELITLGTAGFTAAQCVDAILDSCTSEGEVVVSGSTGGVGIFAVRLLKHLGFSVVASTGKRERWDWLKQQGAARVVDRQTLLNDSTKPLAKALWSAAVDTVGGETLASIIRAMMPHTRVAACGLTGGNQLNLTVYPFILRGVSLIGIDSALVERDVRCELWNRLASEWKLDDIESLAEVIALDGLPDAVKRILAGHVAGRVIVDLWK
ncbi:MAG: YhdH/YhfP family quinone oxidoreductase [Pirellulaceae bacterium]